MIAIRRRVRDRNPAGMIARGTRMFAEFLSLFAAVVMPCMARPVAATRPNFLVIVADDLGMSDLGSFGGGEIDTPNLDRLARAGLRFSSFYTAPTCSPSRAMLLTGVDAHKAGLGNMAEDLAPNQEGHDEYLGHLNLHVATVAERLQEAGYATMLSGKWHLGGEEAHSPKVRGFERSFALLGGGASHYDMTGSATPNPRARYRRDGKIVDQLPAGFYSSDYYASQMIDYLNEAGSHRPFFAYLAFTAPHWPLQAPAALIQKYLDRYQDGPAALRERRLQGLLREGILERPVAPRPFVPGGTPWQELSPEQRTRETRKMAVFAAMVDSLDANVGRVLDHLRRTGQLDSTIVIFLSDNGAEGHDLVTLDDFKDWVPRFDNRTENLGLQESFVYYGAQWAQASTAPSRLHKGFPTEGGIHVPAFIWNPAFTHAGIHRSTISVMDLAPTILELAHVAPVNEFHGHALTPIEGRSLAGVLRGDATRVRSDEDYLGWELFGRSGIRVGSWKAVQLGQFENTRRWELYNLVDDPAETRDLASDSQLQMQRLLELWRRYATENHVILPDTVTGY